MRTAQPLDVSLSRHESSPAKSSYKADLHSLLNQRSSMGSYKPPAKSSTNMPKQKTPNDSWDEVNI